MKRMKLKTFVMVAICHLVLSNPASAETHWNIQAVDANGYGSHPDLKTSNKITVEGFVLNRADYMLDSTPDYDNPEGDVGAQWQIYIQGDMNDHAGTAVWMGQNYDNVWGGSGMYEDPNWTYELYRLGNDPCTAYQIRPGDKIRVTGLLKFYSGKTNINERHNTNPDNDVKIELIESNVGLPQPELVALGDLVYESNEPIFDATRLTGCEYYQARLIRINDVNIVDCGNWGPDDPGEFQTLTIRDSTGRTFPLKLGIGPGFTDFECPSGQFDVIGILDQESSDMWVCKDGYRLWVVNYDGNGKVLTDFGFPKNRLPGDINLDGKVDFYDLCEFANNWLEEHPEGA
jgi:hypothetical protein